MPLTPVNPSLTNADQTLTKVDTRLTNVDKTYHCQPPGATRTNLNNPEQIRTTPNTAEPPDQIGAPPESPPNTQKKTTLNTVAAQRPAALQSGREHATCVNTPWGLFAHHHPRARREHLR